MGFRLPLSSGEVPGAEKPLIDLSRLIGRSRDMALEREELPLLVARFEVRGPRGR